MNRIGVCLAVLLGASAARAADPVVGEWVTLKGVVRSLLFVYPDQTYMSFEYVPGSTHMRVKEFGLIHKAGPVYVMRARRMVLEWPAAFDPEPKHAKSSHPANSRPYPLRTTPLRGRFDAVTGHFVFGGRSYARIGAPSVAAHPPGKP